ncbi:hypothetical protein T11_13813 [Trichinella zimbabwensis]|uniref:Uncharacterized protein n=1 Tax=Trichinella zimbabwensis TaxID=268475 RepID=A0A0V1HN76_9BILA|nr:hypothetical protein T11_13813 [Trichinella zimbabwensis]
MKFNTLKRRIFKLNHLYMWEMFEKSVKIGIIIFNAGPLMGVANIPMRKESVDEFTFERDVQNTIHFLDLFVQFVKVAMDCRYLRRSTRSTTVRIDQVVDRCCGLFFMLQLSKILLSRPTILMTCFPRAEITFRSWSSADQGIFFAFFDSFIITSAWRALEACLIAVMHQQACCQIRHRERFTSSTCFRFKNCSAPLVETCKAQVNIDLTAVEFIHQTEPVTSSSSSNNNTGVLTMQVVNWSVCLTISGSDDVWCLFTPLADHLFSECALLLGKCFTLNRFVDWMTAVRVYRLRALPTGSRKHDKYDDSLEKY